MPNVATAQIPLPLKKDDPWWLELARGVVVERGYGLMDGIGREFTHSKGAVVCFLVPDDLTGEAKASVEAEVSEEMTRVIIAVKTTAALDTIRRFREAEHAGLEIQKAASRMDEARARLKDAGEVADAANSLATAVATYGPLVASFWTWIAAHVPR